MASFVEQYQKLYEQALEAQKKNAKNKKATTSDPKSQLGQKATPTTTNKTSTNKTVSTKNSSVTKSDVNKIVANAKVAQPNYKKFTKSQTEAILEKGKKALADREKDFNEWYTEDKKDMLFNADGTYRDLRTELDEFKAKSNTWKMTAKERHEYNTYKKELETAIEHSDYLQSRDKEKTLSTAEEKKDFYLMQDAYYDTFGEKAAMKIGKVGAGILNMPFQVADVVNDFVNPNFDINDPNNISNQITSAVNRAEEESQYNTSDAEQLGLSLTEVVADYTAHALLSIVTKIPLTVSMGAKSGLSKYAQNRAEGYDEQTSLGNATLTAIMTGLTEKLPFDNVKNIASSKLGQFSIGAILSQGISESLEEGAEYGIEPIIDFATLGKRPDYKAGELFEVMALGFLSGDIIGAGANTISVVRTRKGANKLKADMQTLTDYASSNELTDTEKIAVNDVLVLGNKALSNFEDKSILGDAVQFGSDKVQKRSVAEIMQNFNSFLQPQIDAEAKTYKERAALNNIVNNAQQVLLNKGIQMDAVQYSSLNEDVKKQVDTLQGLARDLKQDVVFNSELTAKGKTIDGYYNNKTGRIVINPLGENPAMSTFVHELTHGTESSKLYNRLKELVFASNENFKEEVQNVKDRYKSVTDLTDEGAEQEYVAIYLQEKLGNEDFVKRLVKYDTSLAARIYEGVKKVVFNTKTSQDVEYAFMKAFRDSGINEQDVKQYAIGKTMDGIDVALADNAISKKEALNLKKVKQYLQNNIGKTFEIKSDGTIVDYTNYDVNEYLYSKYAQNLSKKNINKLIVKNRIVTDLGEIIEVSRNPNFQTNKNNKVHQSDPDIGKKGFTHYETTFGVPVKDANGNIEDYNIYEGELIVEHNNNNSSTMYDIINIKKSNRKLDPSTIGTSSMFGANSTLPTASKNNISNNATNVNNSTNNSDRSFSIGISTQDVKGRTLSKQQQEYFKNSKARDENGNLKVYYHGTSRADRVGTVFDPERATSGPMAYFTDSEQIASNYARDKRDTSIAYDERYDSYYTQFRINHNGEDISVTDYWNTLPLAKRREITEKAKHITMDDDWENVVYDEDVNNGLGNMDQHLLREHNGNAISALISSWVEDGNIYGEESKFLDVLELIGIENAQYLDPNYRDEKVYETYLNITNPLDTSELDVGFVDDLEYWINNNDMTPYQKESSGADTWDKNNWNLNEWVDRLRDDVENGTTHAWTSIPDAVTAYLKEQGYDGISDTGGKNGGTTHQVMIPFDSNQVKNVDNSTPTTNRDIRYSVGLNSNDLHDQALDEYGAFEKGEIPVRDVEIAKETDYGKTNRFARTIAESGSFDDEQVDLLKSKIGEGEFAYESLSNKKLQDDATFKIEKVGLEKSIENYLLEEGYSSKSIAEGEILLDTVARSGDNDMAIKLASKLSMQLTEAGRAVQAARLLKRLTPQGQLVVAERTIAKLQKSLDKRYGEKSPNLEINEELKTKLLNSKNETEMYQTLDEISVEVGKQIPSTLMDKLNTWRYLAMLGNPRTHVRNVLGNAMFYPLVTMKNNIGTVLEASAKKAGKLDTRTKSVLNPFDAKDKALIEFGKENFAECKQLFEKAGKYDLSDLIEQNREVYSNDKAFGRTLNKLVKTNSDALEWGDVVFSKQRYASSLAQYMKANGLTQNDVGKKEFVRAQEYAYKEATKQTYRDASTLATAAEKLAKTNKVTQLAVDAILPFKKTPMNVLSRGVEYSPIGLISTVTKGSMELKKGNITANEFIDSMSAGLTGTGVTLLGAFLASVGAFRTRDDDKDRKQQMDNDLGEQDYALVFPHGTYTIDWASPMIMPLAIGAELFNGIDSFKNIDDLVTVASKITEPIFETSMLSGVASTFQSYESGQKGVFNMIQNAITSYVNQYFPTLFGQVARSIDDTRRTTYPNTGTIDKTGKQILNKIPGLSYLNEPYINKKGEEQKQEGSNVFSRMFLNMLSPGYYKSKTIDKYDEELLRLYNDDVSNIGVLPSSSTNKVTYEKETYKLLDEDYTKFNQTRYSLEREYTDGFIDSDIYNTLTDSERVSIISKMREYAGKEAKNQYLIGIGKTYDDSEYTKVKGALDTGIELYEYYLTKSYYNSLSGKTKKSEYVDYLINSGYSAEEMTYLYDMIYSDGKLEGHVANASLSDEELKSKAYAKAMSKSKKSSTSSKYKKVDEIVNKVRKSSSSSGDSKVDEILKKLKNASSSGDSSLNTSNSSLLKRYLKEHAYDAAKFK